MERFELLIVILVASSLYWKTCFRGVCALVIVAMIIFFMSWLVEWIKTKCISIRYTILTTIPLLPFSQNVLPEDYYPAIAASLLTIPFPYDSKTALPLINSQIAVLNYLITLANHKKQFEYSAECMTACKYLLDSLKQRHLSDDEQLRKKWEALELSAKTFFRFGIEARYSQDSRDIRLKRELDDATTLLCKYERKIDELNNTIKTLCSTVPHLSRTSRNSTVYNDICHTGDKLY